MARTAETGKGVRDRKRAELKQRLLDAAVRVVGEDGYSSSSIARITSTAGVAHGTFYNYFPSQQDLFDELLPYLGNQLLKQIRQAIGAETDFWIREEMGFRTFFRFVQTYPQFYRILNEAETFAATGYRNHIANMVGGYVRAVRRGVAEGTLRQLDEEEIEVVVYTLLAARNYLCMRYALAGPLPDFVTNTYMQLVRHGLTAGDAVAPPVVPKRPDIVAEPRQPELIWNMQEVKANGDTMRFEAVMAVGFAADDIGRASALAAEFVGRVGAAIREESSADARIVMLNLTLGGTEGRPFSTLVGEAKAMAASTWTVHVTARTADGTDIFRADSVVHLPDG